jgi:hypothetical protein
MVHCDGAGSSCFSTANCGTLTRLSLLHPAPQIAHSPFLHTPLPHFNRKWLFWYSQIPLTLWSFLIREDGHIWPKRCILTGWRNECNITMSQ